jgi:hypothetical protein
MFRIATTAAEILKCQFVRGVVLVEEQGLPYSVEKDDLDSQAIHILGEKNGEPIAAARVVFDSGTALIDRGVVRKAYREEVSETALIEFTEALLKEKGFSNIQHSDSLPTVRMKSVSHAKKKVTSNTLKPEGRLREAPLLERDKAFLKKMDVPLPRLSPEQRAQRRMSFANQRNLYWRTCAGTGKKILSNYPPENTMPVYEISYWYSDNWDQHATGRDYDFSRPFFEQFKDLMQVAPRPNLQRSPEYDENCEYTNYAGKNKNCYMIFDSDKNWDCFHSYSINSCRDVLDCFRLDSCELCYECIDCSNCYGSVHLQNCDNCSESYFLKNCIGCSNCFGCVNLRNKKYCFLNKQYSKEDYQKKIESLGIDRSDLLEKFHDKFVEFSKQFPQRFMQGIQNENVVGDYLNNCKNAYHCFDSRKLWDCSFIQQAFDDAKNCMDCTEIGDGVEFCYECCYLGYNGQNNRFSTHALGQSSSLDYCYYTPNCNNCFGCIGLNHSQYCILNKKYSAQDYESMVIRIIEHMKSNGEWGEFFPAWLSPFPYNITHAHEYFPISKSEALDLGYTWREEEKKEYKTATTLVPNSISETNNTILSELLACRESGKNYKIQKQELGIHKKMGIPLSPYCPDHRHLKRLKLRNPRVLYLRDCDETGEEIYTTISPDRPERVFSEAAFNTAVE